MFTFTEAQLRHQPGDISETGLRFVNCRDLPADRCFRSDAVLIGPTAIDFSMLSRVPVPTGEAKSLANWKHQDLSQFYKDQRSNNYR
jgi:hypothetical protein